MWVQAVLPKQRFGVQLPPRCRKLRGLVAKLVLEELAAVTRVQLFGEKSHLLPTALHAWERAQGSRPRDPALLEIAPSQQRARPGPPARLRSPGGVRGDEPGEEGSHNLCLC